MRSSYFNKNKILIYLFIFYVTNLFSQNEFIKFEHLTIEDGMSQNTIHCIIQDKKGFLWFGTQDGLNKYSGYDFMIFRTGNQPNDLSSVWIYDIIEDEHENIFLATRNGLNIINTSKESIKHYFYSSNDSNSISNNQLTKLIECQFDSVKEIWIGTIDGLNKFDQQKSQFEIFRNIPEDSSSISDNMIKSLYQDKNKNFWIGTSNGLNLYNYKNKKFKQFFIKPGINKENQINEITEDNYNNLLIGTEKGLFIFLKKKQIFVPFHVYNTLNKEKLSTNSINCILNNNNEDYWIGTSNGVYIFDVRHKTITKFIKDDKDLNSISGNYIYDIFKDNTGSFWIGTYSGGLDVFHSSGKKFTNYKSNIYNKNSLNNNDILSICEDKDGILWIGTYGGGVNRFDRTNNHFKHYVNNPKNKNSIPNNRVRCITEAMNGKIWFGTDGGGMSLFDKKTNTFTNFQHIPNNDNSLSNNKIRAIKEDSKGIIWIGTSGGGLNKFNPKTKKFTKYLNNPNDTNSISTNFIYNLLIDNSDSLYIETDGGGLVIFDTQNEIFTSYSNNPNDPYSINNDYTLCIHKSHNGIFWIGTDIGLSKFDTKNNKFYNVTNPDFPRTMIYGILEDNNQNLWCSSNAGIIKYNYINDFVRLYDIKDGIQSNEFWGNSYFKNKKGEFFFGGINGFTSFYPDKISIEYRIPKVYFTQLSINNQIISIGKKYNDRILLSKTISETKEITLNYQDRFISIEYVAPNYINPYKVKYAYKMDGFDVDWHYINETMFASYTNLPSGKYIFKAKACNEDGEWDKNPTTIIIIIKPPFWETWWFISIIVIVIIGSISLWYWNKLNQIKKQNILLELKVKERTKEIFEQKQQIEKKNIILETQKAELAQQTEEISAQRDALEEANTTKDKFFSIISHDLKSPFNSLLGFAEIIVENISVLSQEKIRKYTHQMHYSAKQLYNLVENLLAWSRSKRNVIKSYPERLNLFNVVESVMSTGTISAEKKQIELVLEMDSTINVYADENLISTTVRNLISNAIKYSLENSEVKITAREKNEFAEVSVTDTGIGIKKEDIKKLFREDIHFTTQGTNDEKGTGLGLILCKEFAKKNGGKIWVDSEIGKGTTFTFTIPLYSKK